MMYFIVVIVGLAAAGIIAGGVFRIHDEWKWMRPKKECLKCEVPRNGADLLPIIGDIIATYRCRSCKAHVAWQYPVIEIGIFLLVMFHFWRYTNGIWVPDGYIVQVWLWLARDIVFTLFLVIVFVYDLKYTLILDKYTLPGIVIALILNFMLGVDLFSLGAGMLMLSMFFLIQYAMSNGRLLGAGDIRMGVLMGAMLGFAGGLGAMMLAYIIGGAYAICAIVLGKHKIQDRVPFGTFLSVATFIVLVWQKQLFDLFL